MQCGGKVDITSELGKGTEFTVCFEHDHIDRAPIGDMAGTMETLIAGSPEIDFVYRHTREGKTFTMDTREIKNILGDVPLDIPEVLSWIEEFIKEGLGEIC